MTTVEPPEYRSFEGKDISDQEQVKRMLKSRKPVLSSVFRSVEGYYAVDAEYPVFNPEGSFIGSVSVLFKPEKLLGDIIRPLVKGLPIDIWAMEQGGRLLYDVDPAQVGLNLFTSPEYRSYKQVIRLAKKIAKTPKGDGGYRFKKGTLTGPEVNKKAYWQSVVLYGTSWRLVGIHLEQNVTKVMAERPSSETTTEQSLEQFAAGPALVSALAEGREEEVMKLFGMFYRETPGIYSVQWMDSKGVNRFGYPAENSLIGYDYTAARAESDSKFIEVLKKKQPAAFDNPLLEGRTGSFVFNPVYSDGRYLGMVYSIRLK
jgi:hypothetical protein